MLLAFSFIIPHHFQKVKDDLTNQTALFIGEVFASWQK
jgi:hypothetical protein